MDSVDIIDKWMLEYACAQRMPLLLKVYGTELSRRPELLSPGAQSCVALRFATYTLHILLSDRHNTDCSQALSILQNLYNASQEQIPFKHFVKIETGLKILVLFEMLKRSDLMTLPKLNAFFPRTGFKHVNADAKLEKKLSLAQQKFRKMFLTLIGSEKRRKQYLKEDLEEEFGEDFFEQLQKLTHSFVSEVESSAPPTMIDRLLLCGIDSPFAQQMAAHGGVAMEILLDTLHGNESLTETQLMEAYEMLHPITHTPDEEEEQSEEESSPTRQGRAGWRDLQLESDSSEEDELDIAKQQKKKRNSQNEKTKSQKSKNKKIVSKATNSQSWPFLGSANKENSLSSSHISPSQETPNKKKKNGLKRELKFTESGGSPTKKAKLSTTNSGGDGKKDKTENKSPKKAKIKSPMKSKKNINVQKSPSKTPKKSTANSPKKISPKKALKGTPAKTVKNSPLKPGRKSPLKSFNRSPLKSPKSNVKPRISPVKFYNKLKRKSPFKGTRASSPLKRRLKGSPAKKSPMKSTRKVPKSSPVKSQKTSTSNSASKSAKQLPSKIEKGSPLKSQNATSSNSLKTSPRKKKEEKSPTKQSRVSLIKSQGSPQKSTKKSPRIDAKTSPQKKSPMKGLKRSPMKSSSRSQIKSSNGTSTRSSNRSPVKNPKRSPTKGSPTKGSPTKGSPTKGSPTKGSPTKGSPTKRSPTKSSKGSQSKSPVPSPITTSTQNSSSQSPVKASKRLQMKSPGLSPVKRVRSQRDSSADESSFLSPLRFYKSPDESSGKNKSKKHKNSPRKKTKTDNDTRTTRNISSSENVSSGEATGTRRGRKGKEAEGRGRGDSMKSSGETVGSSSGTSSKASVSLISGRTRTRKATTDQVIISDEDDEVQITASSQRRGSRLKVKPSSDSSGNSSYTQIKSSPRSMRSQGLKLSPRSSGSPRSQKDKRVQGIVDSEPVRKSPRHRPTLPDMEDGQRVPGTDSRGSSDPVYSMLITDDEEELVLTRRVRRQGRRPRVYDSPATPSSYHTCVSDVEAGGATPSPQSQPAADDDDGCIISPPNLSLLLHTQVSRLDQECPLVEGGEVINASYAESDSGSLDLSPTLVVPSSYSFDKFNVVMGSSQELARRTLPNLGAHLQSSNIRKCIVALNHHMELDVAEDGEVFSIYS